MNTETNTIEIPQKVFKEIRWHLIHFYELDDYIKRRENQLREELFDYYHFTNKNCLKNINSHGYTNDISFNEFFENHKLKILSKNKEYNDLKSKRRKIYDKYPEIMHLIEDSVPMTFDVEKVQAFDELQTICSMMDKIEVKEAYKLGAK